MGKAIFCGERRRIKRFQRIAARSEKAMARRRKTGEGETRGEERVS
jgi:hypothetical protein